MKIIISFVLKGINKFSGVEILVYNDIVGNIISFNYVLDRTVWIIVRLCIYLNYFLGVS